MCYPSHPIMETPSERITEKLWLGALPSDDPVQTWGGQGTSLPCDGCDLPILPSESEIEVDLPGGRRLRFHVACDGLWRVLKGALPDRKRVPPPLSSL